MEDINAIFEKLSLSVRQAGVVARSLQGKVQNEGKEAESVSQNESERLKATRAAKTLVDEVVQEIILTSLLDVSESVLLDAEEETPLALFFKENNRATSVVIDPIDGTLEYIEGRDDYSICVGIVERGTMKLAIVFFPARDTAYVIAPDAKSYECKNFGVKGMSNAKEMILPNTFEKIVYKNSRTPEEIVSRLQRGGYIVIDDQDHAIGAPQALLEVTAGKASAYFSETRQMRDILIGAVLGNAKGGFAKDGQGADLVWPLKGRVSRAVFGNSAALQEISKTIFI